MLQTFDIAMDDFMSVDNELHINHLAHVVLVADRTPAGSVYVDQIGWAAPGATAIKP
jgi:hypothetical protein